MVPLWDARTTETNITDNDEGGGLGDFWVFEGPSIRHLMTDNNAGGNGNEFGGAVHTAGPGANINFDSTNWRGADDAGRRQRAAVVAGAVSMERASAAADASPAFAVAFGRRSREAPPVSERAIPVFAGMTTAASNAATPRVSLSSACVPGP